MVKRKRREKIKQRSFLNEEGQALIEFILFFPFLLMMYSVTLSIANSINASINQQKVTRGYFYYRLQNNSMAPVPERGEGSGKSDFNVFGQHVNLWGVKLMDNTPVAACFKFNVVLGQNEGDVCEEAYTDETTQFIRVGTAYGICGATYEKRGQNYVRYPNNSQPQAVVGRNACFNK